MLPIHVALVSELPLHQISPAQLTQAAAALQKQVTRDFGPIWGIHATVNAFVNLDQVPIDYWPIVIETNIHQPGAAGVHLDQDGQPFALVQFSNSWTLTASHECLEMLADPFGNRLIAGQSVMSGQGRVRYLVEVCDPCEGWSFAYRVNGITVSDFFTPHFFDPTQAAGVRYSFQGNLTEPRQVLRGGYLSWQDPVSQHWWQEVWFGDQPEFRDLGVLGQLNENIRTAIDRRTPQQITNWRTSGISTNDSRLRAAESVQGYEGASEEARAAALRAQIATLKNAP